MLERIEAMLTTQLLVNQVTIGTDWMARPECDFHLAIQQECAEGQDHLAWKWWSKQEANIPRAQVEAIDIMHFVLAAEMRTNYELFDEEEGVLGPDLLTDFQARKQRLTVDAIEFHPGSLNARQLFSLISTMAGLGHTSFGLVILLGEKLGIGFDEFYKLYSAKATLNIFRQKHGYREGTYRKIWALPSTEDNEVMQGLMTEIRADGPEYAHNLYHLLEQTYAKVCEDQGGVKYP